MVLHLSVKEGKTLISFFSTGKPKISLSIGPSYVEKSKSLTFPECHVTSFPPAVITWSKVHGELVQARTVSNDGRLSITNAQKLDSGLYKCKASNILGHESAVTQLVVVELPQFTVSPPATLKVNQERNITVPCKATGDPQPTVTWVKKNGSLPFGRSKVSSDGTLQIWNTKWEDAGTYTCRAVSNEVITKEASSIMELVIDNRGKLFMFGTSLRTISNELYLFIYLFSFFPSPFLFSEAKDFFLPPTELCFCSAQNVLAAEPHNPL